MWLGALQEEYASHGYNSNMIGGAMMMGGGGGYNIGNNNNGEYYGDTRVSFANYYCVSILSSIG